MEEVQAWVQNEVTFWSWLEKIAASKLGLTEDQRGKLHKSLRQARERLYPNPPDTVNLGGVKASLAQYASLRLVSSTPRAAYVESFRARFGDMAAAASVAQFLGSVWGQPQSIPQEHRYEVELGRHAIFLFDFGLGKGVNHAFRSSFEKLSSEFSGRAEQILTNARSGIATIKAEREQASADQVEWRKLAERSLQETLERFNEAANTSIDSIGNTEQAFKEQMKLRASVKYWEAQSDKHVRRGHLQKLIILLYATAVSLLSYWTAIPFFDFMKSAAADLEGKSSTPLLILAGLAVLLVSIALWMARILVRIFMEERHRALDAAERAVMAETYSALTAEGLVAETERVLVLSTMFRPAGESSAKEDGPETLQHAILAKLLDVKAPQRP